MGVNFNILLFIVLLMVFLQQVTSVRACELQLSLINETVPLISAIKTFSL